MQSVGEVMAIGRTFRESLQKAFRSLEVGLKDQLIFPEISYDDVAQLRGFDITVVTTAKTDEEALALLKGLGMPLAAS